MKKTDQELRQAKWLRFLGKHPDLVKKVRSIRDLAFKIRKLESEIWKLAEAIDDHEDVERALPFAPIDRYVAPTRDIELNGFHWWEHAPIDRGDESERGFLKSLAMAFALCEEEREIARDRRGGLR